MALRWWVIYGRSECHTGSRSLARVRAVPCGRPPTFSLDRQAKCHVVRSLGARRLSPAMQTVARTKYILSLVAYWITTPRPLSVDAAARRGPSVLRP